jgi:hypothetical protein
MKEQEKIMAPARWVSSLVVAMLIVGIAGCAGGSAKKNSITGQFTNANGQGVEIELRKWTPGRAGQQGRFSAIAECTSDMTGKFELRHRTSLPMDFLPTDDWRDHPNGSHHGQHDGSSHYGMKCRKQVSS